MNLIVVGSSKIAIEHIVVAKKVGFKVLGIFSSRKKSINALSIQKKFKINNNFTSIDQLISYALDKNCSIIIAGRIKDNEKILKNCLKNNIKVLIEKPVFLEPHKFNSYTKYKEKIFIGYNRLFYENIKLLKRKLRSKKNIEVIVNCPEKNLSRIKTNSCHIISIIIYLFPDAKVISSTRNGNNYFIRLISTQGYINIFYNMSSSDNFGICIYSKKEKILLSPIESLKIFNDIKKIITKKGKIFIPKIVLDKNEYQESPYKPGFLNQIKCFKKFINKEKIFYPNIIFAKKVMILCDKISKII